MALVWSSLKTAPFLILQYGQLLAESAWIDTHFDESKMRTIALFDWRHHGQGQRVPALPVAAHLQQIALQSSTDPKT